MLGKQALDLYGNALRKMNHFCLERRNSEYVFLIDVNFLCGFFTALYSAPRYIEPPVWLSALESCIDIQTEEDFREIVNFATLVADDINQNGFESKLFADNKMIPYVMAPDQAKSNFCKGYIMVVGIDPMFLHDHIKSAIMAILHMALYKEDTKTYRDFLNSLDADQLKLMPMYSLSSFEFIYDYWIEHGPREVNFDQRMYEASHAAIEELLSHEYRKIGRNDPCLCGSGKKFKRCCLH